MINMQFTQYKYELYVLIKYSHTAQYTRMPEFCTLQLIFIDISMTDGNKF